MCGSGLSLIGIPVAAVVLYIIVGIFVTRRYGSRICWGFFDSFNVTSSGGGGVLVLWGSIIASFLGHMIFC